MEDADRAAGRPRSPEDDLSLILRRITDPHFGTRKDQRTRDELANHPMTRAFLDAGLRIITEQFTKLESGESDNDEASPFFAWLSQAKVVAEAQRTAVGSYATSGQFRDRWRYQPYYIADLLAYSLWAQHWSLHVSTARESRIILTESGDFVDAIHRVAYNDLCVLLRQPTYRISLIAAALAERDSTISAAISETYRVLGESWAALYAATLEARGLKLWPDVTLAELTDMLTALAEGVGMRMISEPASSVIDHDTQRSLLGKAALALAAACVDVGDGQRLEDVVRMIAG